MALITLRINQSSQPGTQGPARTGPLQPCHAPLLPSLDSPVGPSFTRFPESVMFCLTSRPLHAAPSPRNSLPDFTQIVLDLEQAAMIRCIRGQQWDLGNPRRHWAMSGGRETEKAFERRYFSLCAGPAHPVFAEHAGELGSQERNPGNHCVTYNLTSSFPSRVTLHCWLSPFMSSYAFD